MQINLAKSAGFCFGVKRAIKIARKASDSGSRIEMLGDIVHNEEVTRDIQKSGIKKVACLRKGRNKTFLVRAHGIPLSTLNKAKQLGFTIINATCPMVLEIHKIAMNMEGQGRNIIIIGDRKHAEVQGIVGHLKSKPLIIENDKKIPYQKIKKIKRACIVVQSTQNLETVNKIFKILKQRIKDLKFFNTICGTTKAKQDEIKTLPLKNEVMIIIGSKTSANTKRLYEISKSLNKRSFWVQSDDDIRKVWFKDAKSVGITAGASTPDYTTKAVIKRIRELTTPSPL
jgi:4-hydroxy-3-methylbut-2-enyl diphosphate reductase